MTRPLGVTIVARFLAGFGALNLLIQLAGPTLPPQVQAAAASGPDYGPLPDVLFYVSNLACILAGGLILWGRRWGRALFLVCGLVLCVLAGLPRNAQFYPVMEVTACERAVCFALAAWMLSRAPARRWFALAPTLRPERAWNVRGVLSAMTLTAAGALVTAFLLWTPGIVLSLLPGEKPLALDRLAPVAAVLAVLLALGLALGPPRSAGRRTSIVVLCATLVALMSAVLVIGCLFTPLFRNASPYDEAPENLWRGLLAACPMLLLLLLLCVHRLRREPSRDAAGSI